MIKLNNERLPVPQDYELNFGGKVAYIGRMYAELSPEKFGLSNSQFANWVIKTYDQFYLNNIHLSYGEHLKFL